MKRKYKIGLVILLVVIIVAAATVIYLRTLQKSSIAEDSGCQNSSDSEVCTADLTSVSSAQQTKTQIGSFGTPQTITQGVYQNKKLGFELTFSSIWQDAKVTETIPAAPAEGKVEFQIPTQDKSFKGGYAPALTIYVYKSDRVTSINESAHLSRITENNELVYEFGSWENMPSDLGQFTEKEISRTASTLVTLD